MDSITQDPIAKPQSDDMSMDEILASIRKIIATDASSQKKSPQTKPETVTPAQQPKVNFDEPDPHLEHLNQQGKISSTDKLHKKTLSNGSILSQKQASSNAQTSYQRLSKGDISNKTDETSSNQDQEILNALNEIRNNLNSNLPTSATDYSEAPQDPQAALDEISSLGLTHLDISDAIDNTSEGIVENENLQDIDLSPAQFSSDTAPEFLKRFKKQQQTEREKTQHDDTHKVNYDFSTTPTFDDPEDVITLTEKVMPSTKTSKNSSKNVLSELRKQTEYVMQKTHQYDVDDDDADDEATSSSPITSMIRRIMEPMLKDWIDENMQLIAEQVLRDEFRRGLK